MHIIRHRLSLLHRIIFAFHLSMTSWSFMYKLEFLCGYVDIDSLSGISGLFHTRTMEGAHHVA